MSITLQNQPLGITGVPSSPLVSQSPIKAQLLGLDLTAFSVGASTVEALVRRDPGASNASIIFSKTGQTLALPNEIAKNIIGESYGASAVSVEILDRNYYVALSPIESSFSKNQSLLYSQTSNLTSFSTAAQTLSNKTSLMNDPNLWTNLIRELVSSNLLEQKKVFNDFYQYTFIEDTVNDTNSSSPNSVAASKKNDFIKPFIQQIEHQFISLISGSGVGFERAIATLSSRGHEEFLTLLAELKNFPQSLSNDPSQAGQLLSQQAHAKSMGEIMWKGQAWFGAPASLMLGHGESKSEHFVDVLSQTQPLDNVLAWMKLNVQPAGLGAINIWAVILGQGRCIVRMTAPLKTSNLLTKTHIAFSPILESAHIDLIIKYEN